MVGICIKLISAVIVKNKGNGVKMHTFSIIKELSN